MNLASVTSRSVLIPFAFCEAAADFLANAALDPFGKIAEVEYCAVKLKKGGELGVHMRLGGGRAEFAFS